MVTTSTPVMAFKARFVNGLLTFETIISFDCIPDAPEILIPPINITTLESLNTSLYCEAVGNPEPRITWMKHENGILRNLNASEERLKFIKVSKHDAGVYVCFASNIIGNFSVAAKIDVQCKCANE